MATVKAFLRTTKKSATVNVRFRLSSGRNIQLFHKSEQTIDSLVWDAKNQRIKAKVVFNEELRAEFNDFINTRKKLILEIFNAASDKENLTSQWLDEEIDKRLHPEKYYQEEVEKTFFALYDAFIEESKASKRIKQHQKAVKRMLMRFELYKQKQNPQFLLTLDNVVSATLREFDTFLQEEHKLYAIHKDIYDAVPDSRPPKQRGQNRRNKIFRYIRTFYKWAIDNDLTQNNPYKKFKIKEDVYGTPYYITIQERNHLYNFDLSDNPFLAEQRDIFIFQCLIGCRVGDLVQFKKSNVIRDAIEYIPRKTKDGRPVTVRVPLNSTVKEIIQRYAHLEEKLLPFVAEQNYNYAIKDIFALAGLTGMVTIINTITGEEEKKPLNEIASSHLARRTFAGNLYNKVKDPNMVGALTGHKEGSRAFSRYRTIDEEMKKDLVNLLEE